MQWLLQSLLALNVHFMVWVTNTWQCCQYSQLEWTSEVDERMISNHQPADIALKNMLWLFGICTVEGWLPQDPFQSWVSYFKIDHYVEWFRPKKNYQICGCLCFYHLLRSKFSKDQTLLRPPTPPSGVNSLHSSSVHTGWSRNLGGGNGKNKRI